MLRAGVAENQLESPQETNSPGRQTETRQEVVDFHLQDFEMRDGYMGSNWALKLTNYVKEYK